MPRPRDIPRNLDLIDQVRTLRRPPKKTDDGWVKVGNAADEISPSWQNSWDHADPDKPVSFFLDPHGVIRMRGKATGGTSGTVAFTLPEGYRPEFDMDFIGSGDVGDKISRISVAPSGDVTIHTLGEASTDPKALHWGANSDTDSLGLSLTLSSGATLLVKDSSGNPIFRVDESDGSVHIKTGTTVQADL